MEFTVPQYIATALLVITVVSLLERMGRVGNTSCVQHLPFTGAFRFWRYCCQTCSVPLRPPGRVGLRRVIALCLVSLALPSRAEGTSLALEDLSGTAWRLVEIQSMDDSVARPGEGHPHTLVFGIDGSVSARADCNQATGALAVFNPPSIEFDEFAVTGALCGPGSLGERYLRELGWVRSYVYREGRLYLATMADGSILAFDPLVDASVTARVLDLSLVVDDADALRSLVLSRLLNAYARDQDIRAKDSAVDAYIADMDRQMREDLGDDYAGADDLSPDEQAAMAEMRRSMAAAMIRNWEINRSLYGAYGGRVIYQQFGPEPLDAYVAFLRDAEREGRFSINDPALAEAFWEFFAQDQRHDFYPEAEAASAFARAPWDTPEE